MYHLPIWKNHEGLICRVGRLRYQRGGVNGREECVASSRHVGQAGRIGSSFGLFGLWLARDLPVQVMRQEAFVVLVISY